MIVILLLLLTAMLHDEGKGWAAREVAAGSVLHAIDVGLKGQAIRTSINLANPLVRSTSLDTLKVVASATNEPDTD